VLNALTIDVEDYYQVSAFESSVRFEDWPTYESRTHRNTLRVLDLLDEYGVRATFFVLGWEAEQRPALVEEIVRRGHEVASHGYRHRLIYTMTADECREDILRSKTCLERITGSPVVGFRAASYSIVARSLWCLDILIDLGFKYDSSIFPIRHDRYGIPRANRFAHVLERERGQIVEFPLSTMQVLGLNLPIAGGGYLRLLPLRLIRAGIQQINAAARQPAIVYLHPWELDPDQPRLKGSMTSVFRHYTNLDRMEVKFRSLLQNLSFGTVQEVLTSCALA
jgi:polysaccharide deacetylase family protein (PEP-CTERM system associated)